MVVLGGESRFVFEFQSDVADRASTCSRSSTTRGRRSIRASRSIIELPDGATGAALLEGSSPQATLRGNTVTVTGPFAPGKTAVQVGFSLPITART